MDDINQPLPPPPFQSWKIFYAGHKKLILFLLLIAMLVVIFSMALITKSFLQEKAATSPTPTPAPKTTPTMPQESGFTLE